MPEIPTEEIIRVRVEIVNLGNENTTQKSNLIKWRPLMDKIKNETGTTEVKGKRIWVNKYMTWHQGNSGKNSKTKYLPTIKTYIKSILEILPVRYESKLVLFVKEHIMALYTISSLEEELGATLWLDGAGTKLMAISYRRVREERAWGHCHRSHWVSHCTTMLKHLQVEYISETEVLVLIQEANYCGSLY